MSSFINKSGKKVAPKGAPRRRAGGPPAVTPAVPQPSVQPAVEQPPESLQSSEAAIPAFNAPAQLPTPNAIQIDKPPAAVVSASSHPPKRPDIESETALNIQKTSFQNSGPQISHGINVPNEPITTGAPEVPQAVEATPTPVTAAISAAGLRSASLPISKDVSRAAKRRRVEEVVDVVQASSTPIEGISNSLSSSATVRHPPSVIETVRGPVAISVPTIVVATIPESRESLGVGNAPRVENPVTGIPSSNASSVHSPNGSPVIHISSQPHQSDFTNAERLPSRDTPLAESTQASQSPGSNRPVQIVQTAESNAITASSASPKRRAKGVRKDQWRVSTPTDITTGKGKRKSRKPVDRMQIEPPQEAEDIDELNQPSVVTLTHPTPSSDAGPKARKVRKDKGVKRTSKASLIETSTNSTEASNGEANGETADSETPAAEPTSGDQNDPQPLSAAAQKRLENAQKRRAKQLAKTAALSKAAGRASAAVIDKAVAQSINERTSSSSRARTGPTFIVTPGTPDREGTATTGRASVAATEMTEGGTIVHRQKRQKRAETPEENETVFIVESQTSMFDLAGRDTENRVGLKSEREKAMRLIDWEEVKKKRKAENERMARMARGKRTQDDDYDPEEEGMDEDEILARRVARNKNKRPGLQITLMANGEHGIDEQSQMIDRHRLNEDELELLEEVEEDDLTKKFNVQTYGLWRRKEEDERIPHNERWTFDQTEKFYDALTSFGTDFMIISTMFPGMTRRQIKAKFVREERQDPERIRDALTGHNSGRRNGIEGSGWDLKVYCQGAGLSESAFLDPKKIREELERDRLEKEKEIEEARAEAAEEDRQRKLAGALNGDDELDSDGEPLSPGEIVKRAKEAARQKKLARLGEKKRKIMEMAGGSEEVVESIED